MNTLLAFLFLGSLIVILIGAILFFIDYAQKRNKRKSLIIIAVGFLISIISISGFGAIEHHNQKVAEEKQAKIAQIKKQKDKKFKSIASEYSLKYIELISTSEDLAKKVNSEWGNAIDNSGDDYDVDKTIDDIEEKNSDKISQINDDQSTLDSDLTKLKKNNTSKYGYHKFKKANDNITDLTNFVTSPTGSYSDFVDTFNTHDDNASDSYKDLSN
ncbi:O-antigen ligase family protein [Pediococcus claussenii]|uniref:Uncharacterized protein n=1 Tax=Pediococcus claussenii (strain ATCC BAA-344 / DSM 14800 / JCM 18046 / KCTC 3811 / LMG 21948 / P06) TaxID=701521 RepID=G8PD10_PEDCP|nr:O-antigen ligase family protein [Pediococcus claussenii]AEV95145.1 hypothetical protein PECL_873 [Pediococcus claussenii ATCC BAA-344]ANZ70328.1 hypothetical protein AYR57_08365 [Pediococcus claussenii]ANZ72144.1 hypothetical protein AYR58_08365 [Pediococcus claussenii]KRN19672.1 hypothetical protein IV79_GL001390 [Pediococcus claussenii]